MCGSNLNVTRSQGRSRSYKGAGLERWAGPALQGASDTDPVLAPGMWELQRGFNQRETQAGRWNVKRQEVGGQ